MAASRLPASNRPRCPPRWAARTWRAAGGPPPPPRASWPPRGSPAASGRRARRSCRGCRLARGRAPRARRGQALLGRRARRRRGRGRSARAASGAGRAPAVHLAVRGQRQRVEQRRSAAGTMYSGSAARQVRAQLVGGGLARRRRRRRRPAACRPARPRARAPRASRTRGMRGERRLDLAQLDAEAADLDLVVDAAEELEVAVGQPPAEVAGAVQARTGSADERIGDERARRSARAGRGSRGPSRSRRCTARRRRRPAPAAGPAVERRRAACWRSAGRSARGPRPARAAGVEGGDVDGVSVGP